MAECTMHSISSGATRGQDIYPDRPAETDSCPGLVRPAGWMAKVAGIARSVLVMYVNQHTGSRARDLHAPATETTY